MALQPLRLSVLLYADGTALVPQLLSQAAWLDQCAAPAAERHLGACWQLRGTWGHAGS
jgi:hypothetical protein